MKKIITITAVLLLSACGGRDKPHAAPPVQAPPPPPVATVDPFAAQVAQLVSAQPENTEPVSLDPGAPSMPEDTEPVPVGP